MEVQTDLGVDAYSKVVVHDGYLLHLVWRRRPVHDGGDGRAQGVGGGQDDHGYQPAVGSALEVCERRINVIVGSFFR